MRLHRYQNVCNKNREYCNIKRRNHLKKNNDTFNYCLVHKMIISDFNVNSIVKCPNENQKRILLINIILINVKLSKLKNITHQKLHSFCVIF